MKYVYRHVDPRTKEVRYVGQGVKGRAWACGSCTAESGRRGNRTREHTAWIDELLSLGYTPGDFVEILRKGLSNEEAKECEAREIEKYDWFRLFNRYTGHVSLKMTPEKLARAKVMRADGASYAAIAAALGMHTQTVWRGLTNRTKVHRYE